MFICKYLTYSKISNYLRRIISLFLSDCW